MKFIKIYIASLAAGEFEPPRPDRVRTDYDLEFSGLGSGVGFIDEKYPNVVQLHGLPYALPPTGDRRFRKSEILEKWENKMNFRKYAPVCHQLMFGEAGGENWAPGASEDCLYLNIWAPKSAVENPDSKLPVQVYFHGGAFFLGTNMFRDTDGQVIADRQNIIVVSVAYRFGAFGFVHNKAFGEEDGYFGNWGILDQKLALRWVNRYIGNLGGDADNVTISGCSAGGQSTMVHLSSPASWSYFNKVVSFSSPNGIPFKDESEAEYQSTIFLRKIGCCQDRVGCKLADVECLRQKSVTEIQRAAWSVKVLLPEDLSKLTQIAEPFSPVIDGTIISDSPYELISTGKIRPQTPILFGIEKDEGFLFMNALKPLVQTPSKYLKTLTTIYGESSDDLLQIYPPPCLDDENENCNCQPVASDWLTDYSWICNFRSSMNRQGSASGQFYAMIFTNTLPKQYNFALPGILRGCMKERKACHCFNLINYFGSAVDRHFNLTQEDFEYMENLQNTVGNFIRTGNPNDWTGNSRSPNNELKILRTWADSEKFYVFGLKSQSEEDFRREFCDQLDLMDEYMQH